MLFPKSHAWTILQKRLIAATVVAAIACLGTGIYVYERYYRGPDDSFFVGTWRGRQDSLGGDYIGYHFRADHTYEKILPIEGEDFVSPTGKWYAGGDFLYLRARLDDASGPYDKLEIWHIDSMMPTEVRMHYDGLHASLKRAK
jgi:hypothetical protein